jgi:hypothetical protein
MNRYKLLMALTILALSVMVAIGLGTPGPVLRTYSVAIPPAECHQPDGRLECPPGVTYSPNFPR